jgi:hypothetical protein
VNGCVKGNENHQAIEERYTMARRTKQSRKTVLSDGDNLESQERGVGGEGGNMGKTAAEGADARSGKSRLGSDAGMEQMVASVRDSRKPRTRDGGKPRGITGKSKMAPKPLADALKTDVSSMSSDRETRTNPDQMARGTGVRGGRGGDRETSGSGKRTSGQRTNHLKLGRGAGGADAAGD